MRSVTLSGAHNSVPALLPKPSTTRPSQLASYVVLSHSHLRSDSKLNHNSKLFLRNPCPVFSSRHSNQWILRFGRFVQTSESSSDHGYSTKIETKNRGETAESTRVVDGFVALSKSLAKKNTGSKHDDSFGDFLKINMILFGCLVLQGSQPALASTDFSSGISSLPYFQDLGDITTGFASAFLLIFFSELGDKTFFIAALLAARNSGAVVFAGTFGALAAMTLISVALGRTFHYVDEILPFSFGGNDLPLDDIAAVLLLVYFGVSTLLDATSSDGLKVEEEQKEAELAVSEFSGDGAGIVSAASTVISTFFLVFVAEWGDKSFFSTIALSAASSPLGVIAGSLAGHGVATLLAVLGGSLLGSFLSEKAIAYVGGVLFLVFAGITLVDIVK